jgi:hypothetical protein
MAGRPVPWTSWNEWDITRRQLFGHTAADVAAGSARVQAWRLRGRLPLGVDITECFLSMQLRDPSACAVRGPAFLPCESPSPDAALQAEYALNIVRFVNGISDASQKGRVAASVSHHASSAGLHPVLVEVRHAATHSHLPSLHLLRLAASHALSWLHDHYWVGQTKVLANSRASVSELLSQLWANNKTCRANARAHGIQTDSDSSACEDSPRSAASSAAALKREQKSLLGSLRGMAQESRAQDIASILAEHAGQILGSKASGEALGHPKCHGNPQNTTSELEDCTHINASVLELLEAQYPRLASHVMLEATNCLATMLTALLQCFSVGTEESGKVLVHVCNPLIALHAAARQAAKDSKALTDADLNRMLTHNRRTMQTCFLLSPGVPAALHNRALAAFWASKTPLKQTRIQQCAAALVNFLDSLQCDAQVSAALTCLALFSAIN